MATYDTTRTPAECAAENRAAREALERREIDRIASVVNTYNPLAFRMDAAIQFGKAHETTPTLEQAARELVAMCDEIKPKWQHVEMREIQLRGAHLDNQYHPPLFDGDDAYISVGRTRAQWHKFYVALDALHAALAALDAPQRETLSVLCRRDLHAECDDAAHCVCGCHLKSR